MKNVVLITGEFSSAVSTCCFNIAEEFAKQHRVTVLCLKSERGDPVVQFASCIKIVRVTYRWWDLRVTLTKKRRQSTGLMHRLYTVLLNSVRAKEYFQMLSSKTTVNTDLVNSYIAALKSMEGPIDLLIPFCLPIESVVAGQEFKKTYRNVKLMPYLFDPFVESKTLHRTNWNKRIKKRANFKVEYQMIQHSTKIFCASHLMSHFSTFRSYERKFIFTEHPLLKRRDVTDSVTYQTPNCNRRAVYAGVFYRSIRNPEYFLRVMLKVVRASHSELHLYVSGNCEQLIEDYANKSRGTIINHGFVPKQEADFAVSNSDILISVGNQDNTQVPSKTIEYISYCKPIIHFYSNPGDAVVLFLKDYPLSLCLRQDDTLFQENVQKCIDFFSNSKNMSVDFSDVEKVYYTSNPKFISNQMLEAAK